jgi:integrase/recombinase XerD
MKPTDFSVHITSFLTEYLPSQRNVSPNTIKAYRDAFVLFLRYCQQSHNLPPHRLTLAKVDVPLVIGFLEYLENDRHCCPRTRNHRLAAIHSLLRYVQFQDPSQLLRCQQVLAIPLKRCNHPVIQYLSPDEMAAILSQPDLHIAKGRRDAVLLSLLYDSGARVQELIDLTIDDVRLESPPQVHLTGKGRKSRVIPLLPATVKLLSEYLKESHGNQPYPQMPLFFNDRGERFSRSGIRYILSKYVSQAQEQCPNLTTRITPHVFRHSKAMHLIHAGNPLPVIQSILGHADIRTSTVYARANMVMKREALEKVTSVIPNGQPFSWQKNEGLIEWLQKL